MPPPTVPTPNDSLRTTRCSMCSLRTTSSRTPTRSARCARTHGRGGLRRCHLRPRLRREDAVVWLATHRSSPRRWLHTRRCCSPSCSPARAPSPRRYLSVSDSPPPPAPPPPPPRRPLLPSASVHATRPPPSAALHTAADPSPPRTLLARDHHALRPADDRVRARGAADATRAFIGAAVECGATRAGDERITERWGTQTPLM
ncbi:hypothetical protein B0H14DRAFT_1532998 [Mycena olivaceomarginata]|nr:hypothetical protein B0H14DRAFT_1532998 [Mycena olivaceomarginata]